MSSKALIILRTRNIDSLNIKTNYVQRVQIYATIWRTSNIKRNCRIVIIPSFNDFIKHEKSLIKTALG